MATLEVCLAMLQSAREGREVGLRHQVAALIQRWNQRANPRLDLPTVRDYISPMNWLTSVVRPKIRSLLKRETPENMWIKCPETGQLVFYKDVEANHSSSRRRTITCAWARPRA